jgi:hypothetical protein
MTSAVNAIPTAAVAPITLVRSSQNERPVVSVADGSTQGYCPGRHEFANIGVSARVAIPFLLSGGLYS